MKEPQPGFTTNLDEEQTRKLGMIRRWLGSPTLNGALRITILHYHSQIEHVDARMENRPLVKLGQGDYTTEIREEDC